MTEKPENKDKMQNLCKRVEDGADKDEQRRKRVEKVILFVLGWFTIPFITGGVWYDLFGGLDTAGVWQRLTHPRELFDALGIYTIAFATFVFLPKKISKVSWGKRIVYFLVYYFLLSRLIDFLF